MFVVYPASRMLHRAVGLSGPIPLERGRPNRAEADLQLQICCSLRRKGLIPDGGVELFRPDELHIISVLVGKNPSIEPPPIRRIALQI